MFTGTLPIVTDQFATVTVVPNEEIRRSRGVRWATYCSKSPALPVLKTGRPRCLVPPLPGVTPATTCPVVHHCCGMMRSGPARHALTNDARIGVDQNRN